MITCTLPDSLLVYPPGHRASIGKWYPASASLSPERTAEGPTRIRPGPYLLASGALLLGENRRRQFIVPKRRHEADALEACFLRGPTEGASDGYSLKHGMVALGYTAPK